MSRIVVDLPAPLGPRNPNTWPWSTVKLTSSMPRFRPNVLVNAETSIGALILPPHRLVGNGKCSVAVDLHHGVSPPPQTRPAERINTQHPGHLVAEQDDGKVVDQQESGTRRSVRGRPDNAGRLEGGHHGLGRGVQRRRRARSPQVHRRSAAVAGTPALHCRDRPDPGKRPRSTRTRRPAGRCR